MESEMVEPDRTIMIVSIIGLVVIWGSFFYHKFVQGGGNTSSEADTITPSIPAESEQGVQDEPTAKPATHAGGKKNKNKKKKR